MNQWTRRSASPMTFPLQPMKDFGLNGERASQADVPMPATIAAVPLDGVRRCSRLSF